MTIHMTVPLEVGIACRDLAMQRAFYEGVLGFRFVSEFVVPADKASAAALCPEAYTVVRLQTNRGERIKLLARATPTGAAAPGEWILDRPNATYLTFILDDIDAAIADLQHAGIEFMTGPQRVEVRPGVYLAFCRDPEGNVLELVQYQRIGDYRPDLINGAS
ncbi:VOC family protein [Pseudomonas sp. LS44]|uniref:VOC family protein n=1 Tax=Pseudomonas sp. LS44 TaxID=1357074 RepID=UPI00215A74EC|nr:VOC family protein [Pseudomonas sp. LS44]UVE16139.1 VOC family protein [Pseudomonas sp. LS44]